MGHHENRGGGHEGYVVWLLVVTFVLHGLLAQGAEAQAYPPVRFEPLSIEQGLSSVRVWDLLQDRHGFLWIATGDGLNRYDGQAMRVFRAGGLGTLSHDQVWALEEDHAGMLWVGTYRGGLNRFDAATETFLAYRHDPADPASLGDDRIRVLFESPHEPGILWIGTYGGGLDRLDTRTGVFTHYRHDARDATTLPDDIVYALYEDVSGTLWVGTNNGLARVVNRDAPEEVSFATHPTVPNATAIVEDRTGMLWVGTSNEGVFRLDRLHGTVTQFRHEPADATSLSHDRVLTLIRSRDGSLWVGTYGGGVNRFDETADRFERYLSDINDPTTLDYNIVRALYEDRSGLVWFGTFHGGVVKVRPEKFVLDRHEEGNPNSLLPGGVFAVTGDQEDGVWVRLSDQGLTHIAGITGASPVYRHFRLGARDSVVIGSLRDLLTLPQAPDLVWVATNDGLQQLNHRTGTVATYRHDARDSTSVSDNVVDLLHPSPCEPGVVWVGTEQGLDRFEWANGTFTNVLSARYGLEPGAVHSLYSSVVEPCTLWFTVQNRGLFKLTHSPAQAPSAEPAYKIEHNPLLAEVNLDVDQPDLLLWGQSADGRLWFSEHFGLFAFNPQTETFTKYTVADGLVSDQVTSVLFDDTGQLWIATDGGLSRMDPVTERFHNYDITDDLQGNVFVKRSAFKGPDGTLYFGGMRGLTVVHPEQIRENTTVPPVVLTDFRLFNQPVPIQPGGSDDGSDDGFTLERHIRETDHLVLPHAANVLTFSFAALDFTAPEKNRYAYRMEGFDAAWRDAGTQATATYTNLDAGTYVFLVRGSNNDGLWNEDGVRLAITIRPPWYQTWWAYSLYALLAVTGIGGLVYVRGLSLQRRTRVLEAMVEERTAELARANTLKSRFLANISHEFRTPLTLTFGPIDDLLDGRFEVEESARPHFERARRNGGRLLRLINQLLDLSRLDAGALLLHARAHNLSHHLRHLTALFDSMAQTRRIRFTRQLPTEDVWHIYDADKLEKVVVNLLSNAFKFTPTDGKIALTLARDEDQGVLIKVADTGPGIAPEDLTHLFERFYQVESGTSRTHEGTGIGLALVKELVELHEGEITVESTLGFGTRFTVRLPHLEPELEAETVGDDPPAGAGAVESITEALPLAEEWDAEDRDASVDEQPDVAVEGPTVLIVEDNADLRSYIAGHLDDHFSIVEADNGRTGFEGALEFIPDLVISDVMMPERDGLDLCAALKADERTSHIPVILLTARAALEHRIEGFESGADAYLAKPFNARELRVRVETLIEERRRLQARFAGLGRVTEHAVVDGKDTPAEEVLPAQEAAFLKKVEEAIAAHVSDAQFGVDWLAEELSVSRRQLYRKIDALTGQSPSILIRQYRLEAGAALLASGAYSVTEIADRVGFTTRVGFSRSFRQHYGVLPSEYDPSREDGTN